MCERPGRSAREAAREAREPGKVSVFCINSRASGDGFIFHSPRRTHITEVLQRTGDIPTTMRLSGHTSLESFQEYLDSTPFGEKKARQVIEGVDGKLTALDTAQANQAARAGRIRAVAS